MINRYLVLPFKGKSMTELPIVPGRGITSASATRIRQEFLRALQLDISHISASRLEPLEVNNNIESFIGSVEIPLGLVGPLLFKDQGRQELVYTAAGTLEGALIYSMNRGAKVLSRSGGFDAEIVWKKMLRAPLILFQNDEETTIFAAFFTEYKASFIQTAESYSNHAQVQDIQLIQDYSCIHLKVYYSTGDASGQNMTTTCTWHALTELMTQFREKYPQIQCNFVIEGNAASDKKISSDSIEKGRGVRVTARAEIPESVIREVLRTSSENFLKFFEPSRKNALHQGMIGYNINVANAIASIYVATGQDLASVHESSVGYLNIDNCEDGLQCELTLTNLVIGTIGGGTHLPAQQEVLTMMGCAGQGKIERFAKLVAGFALGLEISTFAAIVSGEFAKSHEKLGRNRPLKWLVRADIQKSLVQEGLKEFHPNIELKSCEIIPALEMDGGILTNITQKISSKLIGLILIQNEYTVNPGIPAKMIIRSKALDLDVIRGLHTIASSIDTKLADLIFQYKDRIEYRHCHAKDVYLNNWLQEQCYPYFPVCFGSLVDENREIFLIFQEYLENARFRLRNSENHPESWTESDVQKTIEAITLFHKNAEGIEQSVFPVYKPWEAEELYARMLQIILQETNKNLNPESIRYLLEVLPELERAAKCQTIRPTIIHNDFNPRNIMMRSTGEPVIYDWELAVIDLPSRDILEFLSFILSPEFTKAELMKYLTFHRSFYPEYSVEDWKQAYLYSMQVYLITRISFYEVSAILANYEFSSRVCKTSMRMLDFLKSW